MKSRRIAVSLLVFALPLTVFLSVLWAAEQAEQASAPVLCQGNYHTEEEAVAQLARMGATYSSLDEWKERAAKIRRQVFVGAGLDPLPERTPLNPVIRNRRTYDGYSVESAAFEARPDSLFMAASIVPLAKMDHTRRALHARPRETRPVRAEPANRVRDARATRRGRVLVRHDRFWRFRPPRLEACP